LRREGYVETMRQRLHKSKYDNTRHRGAAESDGRRLQDDVDGNYATQPRGIRQGTERKTTAMEGGYTTQPAIKAESDLRRLQETADNDKRRLQDTAESD
jgi:hypothetical protein